MLKQLNSSPVIPVFFDPDAGYAQHIVGACFAAGLRFFEFTNRGPEAFEVFEQLSRFVRAECPGLSLGIGTIYTPADAERFLEAGADFVVQPVTSGPVADVCRAAGKPWVPGAMTLNEIWAAWQLGATLVKVFPGNVLGPAYIRALRGPLPDVPLMVTGGVEPHAENIQQWLDAGVQAVGIGSQLFTGDFSDDYPALARRIATLLGAISGI